MRKLPGKLYVTLFAVLGLCAQAFASHTLELQVSPTKKIQIDISKNFLNSYNINDLVSEEGSSRLTTLGQGLTGHTYFTSGQIDIDATEGNCKSIINHLRTTYVNTLPPGSQENYSIFCLPLGDYSATVLHLYVEPQTEDQIAGVEAYLKAHQDLDQFGNTVHFHMLQGVFIEKDMDFEHYMMGSDTKKDFTYTLDATNRYFPNFLQYKNHLELERQSLFLSTSSEFISFLKTLIPKNFYFVRSDILPKVNWVVSWNLSNYITTKNEIIRSQIRDGLFRNCRGKDLNSVATCADH